MRARARTRLARTRLQATVNATLQPFSPTAAAVGTAGGRERVARLGPRPSGLSADQPIRSRRNSAYSSSPRPPASAHHPPFAQPPLHDRPPRRPSAHSSPRHVPGRAPWLWEPRRARAGSRRARLAERRPRPRLLVPIVTCGAAAPGFRGAAAVQRPFPPKPRSRPGHG